VIIQAEQVALDFVIGRVARGDPSIRLDTAAQRRFDQKIVVAPPATPFCLCLDQE
jgi:hypothetical protein